MSSLTFVGRLLHDSSGLQYPWAALQAPFLRVPAMIRLPGTTPSTSLTWSMAMPPSVQAFRRSFAGTLQDSPSLGINLAFGEIPIRHLLSQVDVIHQLCKPLG
jgi:hypothetical protein